MVEPANRSVAFRRITELQESDLPMVVRMLQDSQEGWPGGFFAGYTISAEMIRQILEEETPTAVFLSWEGDAVAAFCTVSDWPHDNAAYINLLNSSAHFRGRGHGRDLLRTVIQRCTAQGYDRVDLHTWSGNFRAVPLYKKTGFFWVPDTSVHMQNYLPLLLRVPQLQQFWEEVDPYRDFVRDLSIGEDRMYLGGMLVYIYEFRHGTRFFRAVIDVTARALTALETERWKVSCTVPTRHLAQSVPLTARWEIENHLSAPLPFVLAATGGGGIHVTQETQGSVEHAAQWQATVAAPPDLNIPEPGAEQPGIYSTLFLEGQPLHLRTGLQVYPVVTIRSAPERIQLRPGREREIRLELQNTLQEEITLELQAFTSPGLTVELGTKAPVRILAESVGEVTLGLRAAQNGLGYLELQGSVTRAQGVVSLPPVRLTVAVVDWGQAVWFETLAPRPRFSEDLTQGREVRLETAHQRLVLSTQAGHFSVEDPETNTTQISGRLTFRPPLRWNEQEELRHSVTGVVSGGTGSLRVTTCLPSLPGVVVEHTLTLLGGGILRIDAMVSNGGMAPCDLQLGVSAYGGGEQVTMPLREGLVQDASLEWPDWHDPALFTSERFAEHWLARSDSGQVAGLVWERATLVRPSSDRLGTVRQHLSTLAPGEQRVIGAVYLYGGLGSWQQVRQLWQQRIATKADGAAPIFPRSSVSLLGPHDAPALFTGRPQELRFQSFYARPIQGELTFT
ncbi:MAG: GNAT family N-acetyltransferase, partial [Chloroflexi bacterium]|nr:GNAT family N-acetyltransferase [Chloroflexota bacterium]